MVEVPELPTIPQIFFRRTPPSEGPVTPPPGFDTWDDYWKLVLRGEGMTTFSSPGTVPRGQRCNLVFSRTDEDVATIGLHFAQISGSDVIDWDPASYPTLEAQLLTLWGALKGFYDPTLALSRFVWHDWGVDVRRPNPASRDVSAGPVAGTGTADGQLPPQCAVSITLKTAKRKMWGRVFMPAPVVGEVAAGRISNTTNWRDAFGTLLDAAAGESLPVVIWSPRHGGGPLQYGKANHLAGLDNPDSSSFAATVDQVQVDDLFDVIRSRRYDTALVKSTHTLA